MRRSFVFRLLSSLLAVWFAVSSVAPLNELAMGKMDVSDDGGMTLGMSGMPPGQPVQAVAQHGGSQAAVATHRTANSDRAPSQQPTDSKGCTQHDCCCSALSPSALTPAATLAWLPEHVIGQDRPLCGHCVAYAEGQHRLPFANGPPHTVSA